MNELHGIPRRVRRVTGSFLVLLATFETLLLGGAIALVVLPPG